ncbi:efflux RND transporter periplasmic adaptor subunit [Mitsuaria sp. WAJ17]|uniref:efflux RND transporter periplasmic adaptor subunit n=1 Tax=Mitsuaria sp. WAJ17 TaxID=2761452 RepID=UPI0016037869|nr:efflux RND transporter periplasmic adaptor subunit [Mitsuaria sp. WAJ17]MBB2484371.1 efflux RND transporter periplasmic adaptor subunit [Mitsuaria sp. WAJ17]
MDITKKQGLAMMAIVCAGLLAGTAVLWGGRTNAPLAAQGDSHGHADEGAKKGNDKGDAHEGEEGGREDVRLIRLSAEQRQRAGIGVVDAAAAVIQAASDFNGEVRFNEDRTAHVVPRVAGVSESVTAGLGQQVRAGELLAVIASSSLSEQRSELLTARRRQEAAQATYEREKRLWQEKVSAEQDYQQAQTALREADIAVDNARQKLSAIGASGASSSGSGLSRFEVRAPFEGTIVEKHLSRGEAVREDTSIFTVSDLRSVWAEFAVAPQDLAVVRVGQQVIVSSSAFEEKVQGTISYVGSLLGEQTRTARARVTLANPQGAWRPGLFVTVSVLGAPQQVAVAVPIDAVHRVEERNVVFKVVSEGFQAVEVRTGRADGRSVEILQGLLAGDQVATRNAFILKSELGKASAEHAH